MDHTAISNYDGDKRIAMRLRSLTVRISPVPAGISLAPEQAIPAPQPLTRDDKCRAALTGTSDSRTLLGPG